MILAANVRKYFLPLYLSLTLDHSVFLSSPERRESQLSHLSAGGGAVRGMMAKDTHFEDDGLPPLSLHTQFRTFGTGYYYPSVIQRGLTLPPTWKQVKSL